jgi:hypothetical protein
VSMLKPPSLSRFPVCLPENYRSFRQQFLKWRPCGGERKAEQNGFPRSPKASGTPASLLVVSVEDQPQRKRPARVVRSTSLLFRLPCSPVSLEVPASQSSVASQYTGSACASYHRRSMKTLKPESFCRRSRSRATNRYRST